MLLEFEFSLAFHTRYSILLSSITSSIVTDRCLDFFSLTFSCFEKFELRKAGAEATGSGTGSKGTETGCPINSEGLGHLGVEAFMLNGQEITEEGLIGVSGGAGVNHLFTIFFCSS